MSSEAALDLDQAAAMVALLTDLVARAGAAILAVNREAMAVEGKPDGSPVTEADLAADRIIADGLARLFPDIPTLSEERLQLARPPYPGRLFLIDPLDGTKEFVAGRKEFTVNIALVIGGKPVLGLVGAPDLGVIWRGLVGRGAERLELRPDHSIASVTPIRSRAMPCAGVPWIAAVSRSHGDARTEALIDSRPGAVRIPMGSALKLCRVAEGTADLYPRLAPTCEWDIAAGQAVVVAAGGIVTDSSGAPVCYGGQRPDFIVPEFIAWGDPAAAQLSL